MTATLLSTAATIHAAKLYSPSGTPTADLVRIHAERRAYVGLILSALLEGDDTQRLPSFHAGPYSDRYRHELNFRGEAFGDDVAAEWLYRNVLIEEKTHANPVAMLEFFRMKCGCAKFYTKRTTHLF